jgi:glycosyltransferase involved in cell wall biosynthesis
MRLQILLITQSRPFPAITGGRQRTHFIYEALSTLGDVDIFLQDIGAKISHQAKSQIELEYRVVEWVRPVNTSPQLTLDDGTTQCDADEECRSALLRCLAKRRYDLVVGRYIASVVRAGSFDHPVLIIDVDDVPSFLSDSRSRSPNPGHIDASLESRVARVLTSCAALWVSKLNDRRFNGLERSIVLPNIPYYRTPSYCEPRQCRTIVFVGALKNRSNVEGLTSFIRTAWPLILLQCPDAHLRIVGYGLDEWAKREWSGVSNVELIGYVEDVNRVYRDSSFSIVPVSTERGTHVKVAESCACGRTCVTTALAHKGYEETLPAGVACMVASNMEEFASHCVTLLCNHKLNCSLSFTAWRIANTRFTFQSFRDIVDTTVRSVLSRDKLYI